MIDSEEGVAVPGFSPASSPWVSSPALSPVPCPKFRIVPSVTDFVGHRHHASRVEKRELKDVCGYCPEVPSPLARYHFIASHQ